MTDYLETNKKMGVILVKNQQETRHFDWRKISVISMTDYLKRIASSFMTRQRRQAFAAADEASV